MRRVWLRDCLIYCILPIVCISSVYGSYPGITWISLMIGFLYTFYVRSKEDRVNYTCLSFLVLYNLYFMITAKLSPNMIMQFNFGFVIFIAVSMLLLEMMDVNICKIVFVDILIMKGESKLNACKLIKKSKIDNSLRKLSMVVIMELLCCDLIAFYFINVDGLIKFHEVMSFEILAVIVFLLVEIYHMNIIKERIRIKTNKNINLFVKEKVTLEGKVINLEQYR